MSKIEVDAIDKQSGSTLTLGGSGTAVTLACGATQTGFGRTGTVDWQTGSIKTGDFTAVSGEGYFVNTTSGVITATLPATPSSGDIVSFSDYAGTWDTNNITIARNGSNINGEASDLVRNADRGFITLIYVDGTQGWVITDQSGTEGLFIAATGGTVTTCGNFKIHTFTGPGTFTVSCVGNPVGSDSVDYLVVAGGGGGGKNRGGGGGGGGFRESSGAVSGCYSASPLGACVSALPVTATAFPITVGGGGTGAIPSDPDASTTATNGANSIFSTITSAGGGGGGNRDQTGGNPGGSGGGGGGRSPSPGPSGSGGNGNTPPVSPPQGNNGGGPTIGADNLIGGGSGGGATVVGTAHPTSSSGNATAGGAGATTSISASPTAYAGGGGAGASNQTPFTPAPGGTGGGGNGGGAPSAPGNNATAGTTNTGGGGGGGAGSNCNGPGKAGGSGIVIIRYKFQ